jgi:hypothetical protein
MNKPDTKAECCSDLENESGCRNNYFDGKRLSTDSFRVEQRYFLERQHLRNRAIAGWGVVYGFSITPDGGKLKIGEGLALDKLGRELLQVGEQAVAFNDLLILEDKNPYPAGDKECWLLSVHYAEKPSGPVPVVDSCRCEHQEWERICETVRYSLQRIPCDDCCREFDCELECKCGTGECCDRYAESPKQKRGGCRCLCEHLTHIHPGGDPGPWKEVDDPCGRVRVDLGNGVPLACVELASDKYGGRSIGAILDACGPRRLVKRNDLLFDLIRGCDLTRIVEIGWPWHRHERPIEYEYFSEAFGAEVDPYGNYVTRDFWVKFSRPVREGTVSPDCFAMTAMSIEREGGWRQVFRVPIVDVQLSPDGLEARIVVDGDWVRDAVRGGYNLFRGSETYIEIEVRGDFILDCNGQAVDANAAGRRPVPTGNGTPGGTFLSTFAVLPQPPKAYKGASS